MAAMGSDAPVKVDWKQHAIGVQWISDNVMEPGSRKVKLNLVLARLHRCR